MKITITKKETEAIIGLSPESVNKLRFTRDRSLRVGTLAILTAKSADPDTHFELEGEERDIRNWFPRAKENPPLEMAAVVGGGPRGRVTWDKTIIDFPDWT